MAHSGTQAATHIPGYEVLSELGRGGVSTVYLARHELLEREVAIKVMSPALTVEEGFSKRFIREGQTIARLEHPGIVRVYDVSVSDYRPYIAMEYLPGGSLKDRMKEPIPPEEAVSLLRSIADSLSYAHDSGIFHRDVKPENILFRNNGDSVLTDFGIAKSDSQDTALTSVGVVVGTPRYISPEQAQGHGSDGRADIYALGVILYEMLTGRPPYDVRGSMSLLYAHINDPIPRLPEDLVAYQDLVDDLLAKDPEQRVPDCPTLVARLDGLADGDVSPERIRRKSLPLPSHHRPWYKRSKPRIGIMSTVAAALLLYLLWSQQYLLFPVAGTEQGDLKSTVTRLLEDDAQAVPDGGQAVPEEDSSGGGGADLDRMFDRAVALYTGVGGETNQSAAVELYRQAADGGHALSQFHLGVAYGNGAGVTRNERRAADWLARAAAAGIPDAQYNLILAKIFGPAPNPGEAARVARDLAKNDYAPVYRILGWMYNTGTGVDSSFTQSVRWSMKTMVGDWTGKSHAPDRVVDQWERRLNQELGKIRGSRSPEVK